MARKNNQAPKHASGSAFERDVQRSRLAAQLADRQRQLGENSDKAARCQTIIRECREQLALGRDRQHLGWLAAAALLAIGGSFFLSFGAKFLAGLCFFGAIVFAIRWLAAWAHCLKKYSRVAARLRHNTEECDRLSEKNSELRLETLELRQLLERLDRGE